MRKDKKMYELIKIVSSLPMDEKSVELEQLHTPIDWEYTVEYVRKSVLILCQFVYNRR